MANYRKVPIRTLTTERLTLRPTQESDAPRIQLLFDNPAVLKYMAAVIPYPYPEDGAITYLREILPKVAAGERYAWAIERRGFEGEGMIGAIELTPASDEDHRGFWLGEPYWGQGYMTEAATAVNDFAFDELGMTELRLGNAVPNVASHRLKESVGAEAIEIRDEDFVGGRFPCVRWRLTAEAWRARKRR